MKQPILIPIRHNGRELYQNMEAFPFFHGGRKFVVEEGFVCDGASVPRLLWPWMPPDGLHRAAALAHDRVFAGGRAIDGHLFTLREADLMFLRLMIEAGVPPMRARTTHAALRTGSWYPWIKCKGSIPEILPVRNEAVSRRRPTGITRHLYAAPK